MIYMKPSVFLFDLADSLNARERNAVTNFFLRRDRYFNFTFQYISGFDSSGVPNQLRFEVKGKYSKEDACAIILSAINGILYCLREGDNTGPILKNKV